MTEIEKYQRIGRRTFYWFTCPACNFVGLALRHNIQAGKVHCECKTRALKHVTRMPEFHVWASMKDRCTRKTNKQYADYGGRGIVIAPAWEKFDQFYSDMGPRPTSKHTLERIDVNQGYSSDNCVWATRTEQARNKRNNLFVTVEGRTRLLLDWSIELNEPYDRLKRRLYRTGRITK